MSLFDLSEKIEGLDLNNSEGMLKIASEHLRKASMFLRTVESRPQPHRVSKILNMMAKTSHDDHTLLELLMGHYEENEEGTPTAPFHETITHAIKLYLVQIEEQKKNEFRN